MRRSRAPSSMPVPSLRRRPSASASWRAWVAARRRSAAVAASRAAVRGGLGLGELPFRGLVPLGQVGVAGVESVDLGLQGLVLLLGAHRAFLCLVAGRGQPVDLGLGRGGARAGRVDLSGEAGQPFAAVRDGAGEVLQPAFLDRQLALQFGAVGDRVVQRPLRRLQGGLQLGLLLTDAGGLALQLLGVPAAPLLGRGRGGALDPGVGQQRRCRAPARPAGTARTRSAGRVAGAG